MGKFRACLFFITLIHTTWWDDIPYEISSFVYFGCIFNLGAVLDTEIWGSWSKNEPSENSKNDQTRTVRVRGGMSLRNGLWHGLRNDIIMFNIWKMAQTNKLNKKACSRLCRAFLWRQFEGATALVSSPFTTVIKTRVKLKHSWYINT